MTTESIEPRIDYRKVAPEAIRALAAVERYARGSNLEPALLELVRLRASIINGCAYCVDMHSKDARARSESEQRLYAVSVWWEAVTKVNVDQVPDEVYRLAREHFEERELVDLTMAVIAINSWNRLAISFRALAGTYEPAKEHAAG